MLCIIWKHCFVTSEFFFKPKHTLHLSASSLSQNAPHTFFPATLFVINNRSDFNYCVSARARELRLSKAHTSVINGGNPQPEPRGKHGRSSYRHPDVE